MNAIHVEYWNLVYTVIGGGGLIFLFLWLLKLAIKKILRIGINDFCLNIWAYFLWALICIREAIRFFILVIYHIIKRSICYLCIPQEYTITGRVIDKREEPRRYIANSDNSDYPIMGNDTLYYKFLVIVKNCTNNLDVTIEVTIEKYNSFQINKTVTIECKKLEYGSIYKDIELYNTKYDVEIKII